MRLAAVPVCRTDPSNVPCSLPPTRQLLVATELFFFMYKENLSIKEFHHEGLAQVYLFFLQEPAPNTIKTWLSDSLVLHESAFIQAK